MNDIFATTKYEKRLQFFHAALLKRADELSEAAKQRRDEKSPIYSLEAAARFETQMWFLLNLAVVVALVDGLPRSRATVHLPPTNPDFDKGPGVDQLREPSFGLTLSNAQWLALVERDVNLGREDTSGHRKAAYSAINIALLERGL